MLGQIPDPGSGKVPVIFPARPLADSFTATARLSPLHVYTSHTRPLYTSLPTRQNIEAGGNQLKGNLYVYEPSANKTRSHRCDVRGR